MSIQWYIPRGGKRNILGDFFSLSNERLRFSKEAWEKYFKGAEYLEVGYEESSNCIFLKPNRMEGFKISEKGFGGVPGIRWKGFTSAYRIHFEKAISVKVQNLNPLQNIYSLDLKGKAFWEEKGDDKL